MTAAGESQNSSNIGLRKRSEAMQLSHAHLKPEQLVDYFSGLWTLDQERAIEVHLAGCDLCAKLARKIYLNGYLLEKWTVKRHAEVIPTAATVGNCFS